MSAVNDILHAAAAAAAAVVGTERRRAAHQASGFATGARGARVRNEEGGLEERLQFDAIELIRSAQADSL
jgi:hypothetical protein